MLDHGGPLCRYVFPAPWAAWLAARGAPLACILTFEDHLDLDIYLDTHAPVGRV
jgi:hypothetical protein